MTHTRDQTVTGLLVNTEHDVLPLTGNLVDTESTEPDVTAVTIGTDAFAVRP